MHKSISTVIIFTILITLTVSNLLAQEKGKLYTAKVYTINHRIANGTLESANDKGVYLITRGVDTNTFVNANQIKEIKLRRKGKSGTGATIGFLAGLAGGTGAYFALQNDSKLENTARAVGGLVFTFITTAIGGAIANKPDKVIQVYGRYEDYMQNLQQLQAFSIQGNQ